MILNKIYNTDCIFIDSAELFDLHSTHGYPIEMSAEIIHDEGFLIDWRGFFQKSLKEGWNLKHIESVVESAIKSKKEIYYTIAREYLNCLIKIAKEDKKNDFK